MRDARADPARLADLKRLDPLNTVPVLVDAKAFLLRRRW